MSKYRRRQLFFQQVEFNQNTLAKQIVSVIALDGKLLLSIDRTTWERRGSTVNLLVLSVGVGDVAIPLFWHDLGHDGNSDTALRMALLERNVREFGTERIGALRGDQCAKKAPGRPRAMAFVAGGHPLTNVRVKDALTKRKQKLNH